MALIRRALAFDVTLAGQTGQPQPTTFAGTSSGSTTIEGLRASVEIINSGSPVGCEAYVRIWGMKQSLMNQLSTLGLVFNQVPKNVLTIRAGDAKGGMSGIFTGTIYHAYPDYSSQPDVPFIFMCTLMGYESVAPAKPSTFTGATDVATIVSGLARQMGMGFENNGVDAKANRPYLSGSLRKQVDDICRYHKTAWAIVNGNTLAIWPIGKSRDGKGNIPVISPETGMIDYPAFTQQGIIVKSIFNPTLSVGQKIRVDSSLLTGIAAASATVNFPTEWAINKVDLKLEAEMPEGVWMMTMYAYNPGYARSVIPPAR